MKGTVKAVSDKYGGALTFGEVGPDGKDVWLKYSKPEYREMAWYDPSKGDEIEVFLSGDGKYIKSIVPLRNGADIVPPSEGFYEGPPDEVYERDINADVAPRKRSTDESIQLQVCVKVAGEIMVALIEKGYAPWAGENVGSPSSAASLIGADVAAMASSIATVFSE